MIRIYKLKNKELIVGRMRPCTIVIPDNSELSAQHLRFINNNNGCELYIAGKNGAYVNGKFYVARETVKLSFADEIKIPNVTVMWLEKYVAIGSNRYDVISLIPEITEEDIENDAKELIKNADLSAFNIAKRNCFVQEEEVLELDNPPEKKVYENQSMLTTIGPAFTMALPMIIGFVVTAFAQKGQGGASSAFMYTGLITAVSSAIIGVFWGIMNVKNRKKQLLNEELRRKKLYLEYVKNAEDTIKDKYVKKTGNLRLLYKPAREIMMGGIDKYLIWNRTEADDDFLFVRLGLGKLPFDIKINIQKDKFTVNRDELKELPKKLKNKYSMLLDVPVGTDIFKNKITGILCSEAASYAEILTVIISQLAVNNSPYSLKLACCFCEPEGYLPLFDSVKLLPHLRLDSIILFTNQCLSISELNKNICDIIDDDESDICFVIITDDFSSVNKAIKEYEKACFIVVSKTYEKFPPNVKAIIQREANFSGVIDFSGGKIKRQEIYFDSLGLEEMSRYSRELMGLFEHRSIGKSRLPLKVPFFDLYGCNIDSDYIKEAWGKNRTFKSIKSYIGIDDDGITVLDLHEKSMGPHGLIAGTTGSGKSEILQTIILSLAVNYSPLDVSFFLIDYKGGGMASLFENMPHLAGSISNLSGKMIVRAMASIRSENERRQKLFLKADVNNISEYQKRYYEGLESTPMPHIFIIIDEFAELKREEPAFMGELISVARVGRSLGVHLILATQKPSGTVDDNIWSNSKFKICLRVQDKMDSNEMLHKPDAASLTNPGRAYLQVGNDEIYKLFQSAYTMDKSRRGSVSGKNYILDTAGRKIINDSVPLSSEAPQLLHTIKGIISAYEKSGMTYKNRLWLKPLEGAIIYREGGDYKKDGICIGIYDDPSHQMQDYLNINIISSGNHIILGNLQSGKSTLLTTISYALIRNENPKTCNIYFIDFSNGLLSPFKESHLSGGYIDGENEEDLLKLFILLTGIIDERKSVLKGESFKQHILRQNDMPAVYLIIDGIGSFRERSECRYDRELMYILKNGEAVGVFTVATAVNISTAELTQRFFENFKNAIVLKQSDKYAYKEAMRIPDDIGVMPDDLKGRGLVRLNDETVEFQAFLPVAADSDYERMNTLAYMVKAASEDFYKKNPNAVGIRKIPVIPKKPLLSEFEGLDFYGLFSTGHRDKENAEAMLPIGYEELSGNIYFMPVSKPVYVSGRAGSGKKNLVKVCRHMSKKLGIDVSITIYDESIPFDRLLSIKSEAGDNPFVIHMGGAIDRQSFADFSYIPYSMQSKIKNAGLGTVRKINEEQWYGDIVIPLCDTDDIC